MGGRFGSVGFRGVLVAVIADQADVDAAQEREHKRLDEADQDFQEIEWDREAPA